jgi:hypothetical protein
MDTANTVARYETRSGSQNTGSRGKQNVTEISSSRGSEYQIFRDFYAIQFAAPI